MIARRVDGWLESPFIGPEKLLSDLKHDAVPDQLDAFKSGLLEKHVIHHRHASRSGRMSSDAGQNRQTNNTQRTQAAEAATTTDCLPLARHRVQVRVWMTAYQDYAPKTID